MPVLDRTKIRPDILKLLRESMKVQMRAIFKYLRENKDPIIEYEPLWKRVMQINEDYFKGAIQEKDIINALSMKEMLYLAKIMRYMFDFTAEEKQKNNPFLEGIIIEKIDINGVPAEWHYFSDFDNDKVIISRMALFFTSY